MFRLAGELAGPEVIEFEQSWKTASSTLDHRELVVDLTALHRLDEEGERVLRLVGEHGAKFITASALTESLAWEISHRPPEVVAAPRLSLWRRLRCRLARCCSTPQPAVDERKACEGQELKVW